MSDWNEVIKVSKKWWVILFGATIICYFLKYFEVVSWLIIWLSVTYLIGGFVFAQDQMQYSHKDPHYTFWWLWHCFWWIMFTDPKKRHICDGKYKVNPKDVNEYLIKSQR